MKLRTEMQDGCVHGNGYCVDEDAVELRQAEMLVHDAAAAHALMQAMDELDKSPPGCDPCEVLDMIKGRASDLMANWGFDSGEVE